MVALAMAMSVAGTWGGEAAEEASYLETCSLAVI
jgi:hypothetical protein